VRFVVGFPAGGTADLIGRIFCQWLSERLGQPFVVENKPGAATNIAVHSVATSAPDGYTIGSIGISNAVNSTLYQSLPFDFAGEIAPVAALVNFPLVVEVHPSLPVKDLTALIAYAKAHPGKLNIGSFGVGTISHLAGELLKSQAGIDMVHVPYRGAAPMLADLLAGQLHGAIDSVPSSLGHLRQGTVRALALTSRSRSETLPDVPTVGETFTGFEASAWTGIGAPRKTPPEILDVLNREINLAFENPAISVRLRDLGAAPIRANRENFTAFVASEIEKWGRVVKLSGVKPE
jgi:tripartite-type tricarboxylate transporter receptor subunit TctC